MKTSLEFETFKSIIDGMTDEKKLQLLKLLLPENEPNYEIYKQLPLAKTNKFTMKNILTLLKLIDDDCRTEFSAKFYTTGYDSIEPGGFYDKASYNEIGVIANCKLVGRALLRIVFYLNGEIGIQDSLIDDIAMFEDMNEKQPENLFELIEYMADQESTFGYENLVTETFTSEITFRGTLDNRRWGTSTYKNTITGADVWTLKRIYDIIAMDGDDEEDVEDEDLFKRIPTETKYI